MAVKAKPDGYHAITPYLVVDGAARLIDFLKEAFDAEEVERLAAPGDRIGHAEIRIGDSLVMLGDAHGEHKPLQTMLYVYVDNADAVYQRALAAGATSVQAPVDQFYGDRSGGVKDAFGNLWWIATHIEDVPPAELQRRAQAAVQRADGN
jgi:PhnB protein